MKTTDDAFFAGNFTEENLAEAISDFKALFEFPQEVSWKPNEGVIYFNNEEYSESLVRERFFAATASWASEE